MNTSSLKLRNQVPQIHHTAITPYVQEQHQSADNDSQLKKNPVFPS